jgi:hypothetical protein
MGINTNKSRSPNREYIRVSTASRLMAGYFNEHGVNMAGSSVCGCGRWKAYGRDTNNAEIIHDHDGARFDGHFKCGSVWVCSRCGNERVSQTRSWIRAALIPAIDANNMVASMMTFTMAHTYDGDWSLSIDTLLAAYRLFDRQMHRYFKKIGCIGKLKSLEAPIGRHGIHGHLHVLMVYSSGMNISDFENTARTEWNKAVARVGGSCNEHGFDLKLNATADYLAKHDIAHEMANQNTKAARNKGRTLGQLLDLAGRGDKQASAEWLRAIEALQGRSRFHAGDIAKKLGIPNCTEWEDVERQEEMAERNADMPPPTRITYPLRDHLKATRPDSQRNGLAMILRAAREGQAERIFRMVRALCDEVDRNDLLKPNIAPPSFWDWPDDYFDTITSSEN